MKNSVVAAIPFIGTHAKLPPAGGASAMKGTVREKLSPNVSACSSEDGVEPVSGRSTSAKLYRWLGNK